MYLVRCVSLLKSRAYNLLIVAVMNHECISVFVLRILVRMDAHCSAIN